MNKVKNLERELYDVYQKLSPQRIRKIVKLKYTEKIQKILKDEERGLDERQEKMLKIIMELNLISYFLGYIDALEEFIANDEPKLESLFLPQQYKNQLMSADEEGQIINIFYVISGAVPTYQIKELIWLVQAENLSLDQFIDYLEKLIHEAENKKNLRKKK